MFEQSHISPVHHKSGDLIIVYVRDRAVEWLDGAEAAISAVIDPALRRSLTGVANDLVYQS